MAEINCQCVSVFFETRPNNIFGQRLQGAQNVLRFMPHVTGRAPIRPFIGKQDKYRIPDIDQPTDFPMKDGKCPLLAVIGVDLEENLVSSLMAPRRAKVHLTMQMLQEGEVKQRVPIFVDCKKKKCHGVDCQCYAQKPECDIYFVLSKSNSHRVTKSAGSLFQPAKNSDNALALKPLMLEGHPEKGTEYLKYSFRLIFSFIDANGSDLATVRCNPFRYYDVQKQGQDNEAGSMPLLVGQDNQAESIWNSILSDPLFVPLNGELPSNEQDLDIENPGRIGPVAQDFNNGGVSLPHPEMNVRPLFNPLHRPGFQDLLNGYIGITENMLQILQTESMLQISQTENMLQMLQGLQRGPVHQQEQLQQQEAETHNYIGLDIHTIFNV